LEGKAAAIVHQTVLGRKQLISLATKGRESITLGIRIASTLASATFGVFDTGVEDVGPGRFLQKGNAPYSACSFPNRSPCLFHKPYKFSLFKRKQDERQLG
jgi:hypothetical protein